MRNTYNQRVIEQQEYIANFTKKLNTVIKAGLPELPKNLNDSERQALMEALSPIKADLEDTAILLSIYANTLQRLRNFHEKVADRFIALRDNTNLPTEAEYEPGAIVRNVAKQEKQKDSSLSLDWEKNGNQEKLQKYIDRKVEKSAEWFAAMLLKGNKGSISKNYYLLKAKRHVNPDGESYEPEELEDAWNALDNFIKTLPK